MATLTVGTGVLDGPICLPLKGKPSLLPPCIYCTSSNRIRRAGACSRRCIYYTTTENEIQYHTVSTFIIFFYGNIVTQDPFFPAHAAEAITFVYSDKSNQNRRKRTGRPLDSACLIAVAYATSKAYSEVYGRFMCPRFCK